MNRAHQNNSCSVCEGNDCQILDEFTILGSYTATLLECHQCGHQFFVNSDEWLVHAYDSPIKYRYRYCCSMFEYS